MALPSHYRVAEGMLAGEYPGGDAIATIAELRRAVAGERPSPETPAQEALVRGWRQGQ